MSPAQLSPAQLTEAGRCPVCKARFRGERLCSRCGADLEPLMLLAATAWRLREAARAALREGDFARAAELAAQAEETQQTPAGKSLRLLGTWLSGTTVTAPRA